MIPASQEPHVGAGFTASQFSNAKRARIAQLERPYVGFSRDRLLRDTLTSMVAGIPPDDYDQLDIPDKRRIIAICGESGAGKTRALIEHCNRIPEMRPFVDRDHILVKPVLWFKAPSPSTPQRLAFAGLIALGVPVRANMAENKIWELFQTALKAHRVRFVVIDEAQDAIETANRIEIVKIANAFKNLVQMQDWSLRLVLVGVPPLAEFLERKQLFTRRIVVPFQRISADAEVDTVVTILRKVVVDHAGMALDQDLGDDFEKRLAHACDGQIGSIIQMVRKALEFAIERDEEWLALKHFADAYRSFSGCKDNENVFEAAQWSDLNPYTALRRDGDLDYIEARSTASKSRRAARRA
ncbi:ATP-binding protein (plasmid) [Rhizobium ruizarguesonis]|uniref:ATP-binding protein n=1 Tax=Rhizobium ruizarguesonis TaxID=2081791 RepID=UPI001032727C|nr:ATP-binding protein [Rhizobium ruizarguesonis]TAW06604.1 ATP-binding protein [Rhizobium ruizarguesonis]